MNITLSTYLYVNDVVISHTTSTKRDRRNGGSEVSELIWKVGYVNSYGIVKYEDVLGRSENEAINYAWLHLDVVSIRSVEEVR